ncbi:hypothetical protein EDB19DRAFT_2044819 [Suillus lakei]|nr:hypothetical protein EDB19DRAFT_2044819 [Suillus lakei]
MSATVVPDPSQVPDSSRSASVPAGWTTTLIYPNAVINMLKSSTGFTASIELAEIKGSRYIFLSGKIYYMWNTVNEQGWSIVNVTSRDELYRNMAAGGAGLDLQPLPEFGDDLEE